MGALVKQHAAALTAPRCAPSARVIVGLGAKPGGDDISIWNPISAQYQKCNWLQAPWFFIEFYFYRRVLAATGYFRRDPGNAHDPYQYQKKLLKNSIFTVGATGKYTQSESEIYGKTYHYSSNGSIYSQFDGKFDKLTVSVGGRWEANRLDAEDLDSRPVLRTGLNYQLFDYTFLRASFGQGYRYPTIAEKYTITEVGILKIFPNELTAESIPQRKTSGCCPWQRLHFRQFKYYVFNIPLH